MTINNSELLIEMLDEWEKNQQVDQKETEDTRVLTAMLEALGFDLQPTFRKGGRYIFGDFTLSLDWEGLCVASENAEAYVFIPNLNSVDRVKSLTPTDIISIRNRIGGAVSTVLLEEAERRDNPPIRVVHTCHIEELELQIAKLSEKSYRVVTHTTVREDCAIWHTVILKREV